MSTPVSDSALRGYYDSESERIRAAFEVHGDGRTATLQRAALVDQISRQLWQSFLSCEPDPPDACLVAIGGYGRGTLYPHSDIDLLFLLADPAAEEQARGRIRSFCQEMWDLRMRVSPATRTLAECDRLYHDNIEFTISLLDCRYLAGDPQLFARLQEQVLPRLIVRERQPLVQKLAELTHSRHHKYGDTIFHLEPNLKDGPGGLRDYNAACWFGRISALDKRHWQAESRDDVMRALGFLSSVRCFLHYRSERDDNLLTWDAQDDAAAAGIGFQPGVAIATPPWMRAYFRHARAIDHHITQLLDEVPAARSSLYRVYQQWRSRVSNADFSVTADRIFFQQPGDARDPELMLRVFEFIARHGLKLSADAERRIELALPSVAAHLPQGDEVWTHLRQLLTMPHAAQALRAMHALGLLTLLVPEYEAIDALVIRDYYHRYTVDEHSFLAIDNLHALRKAETALERRYADMLAEIERPELLYLAVLLHDIGKGSPEGTHVEAGLKMLDGALTRMKLSADDADTVRFLLGAHLEMSALMRRDIFDPQTVHTLVEKVSTPDRLKMLCLLTYADIKAVNPEALTPWKADDLWQLYASAANLMDRTVDSEIVHGKTDRLYASVSADMREAVTEFCEGLPRRYLLTRTPEQILQHCQMASRLDADPVQVTLGRMRQLHELTVVTRDRPGLFSTIAGALAGWGMDIVKAAAFCNAAGVIVDTFLFTDSFRTLELNPQERKRFSSSIMNVVLGEVALDELMRGRMSAAARRTTAHDGEPQILFNNDCSAHSTVMELIAADRPGLLYRVASLFAYHSCNLDIALIDTEGHTAIDVFYIAENNGKLTAERQQALREALLEELTTD
jgi:[protein-PII] uridylyltransferase